MGDPWGVEKLWTWGQGFWFSSLLCCLAVRYPFCVEMFGASVPTPVQWSGYYHRLLLYSLQLSERRCQKKAWPQEVSSDDMALIAEASKDLNIAMVVLV